MPNRHGERRRTRERYLQARASELQATGHPTDLAHLKALLDLHDALTSLETTSVSGAVAIGARRAIVDALCNAVEACTRASQLGDVILFAISAASLLTTNEQEEVLAALAGMPADIDPTNGPAQDPLIWDPATR